MSKVSRFKTLKLATKQVHSFGRGLGLPPEGIVPGSLHWGALPSCRRFHIVKIWWKLHGLVVFHFGGAQSFVRGGSAHKKPMVTGMHFPITLSKKKRLFYFRAVKWNFTTWPPLEKSFWLPLVKPIGPPGKILRCSA